MREHATQGKSLPDRRRRSPAARTRKKKNRHESVALQERPGTANPSMEGNQGRATYGGATASEENRINNSGVLQQESTPVLGSARFSRVERQSTHGEQLGRSTRKEARAAAVVGKIGNATAQGRNSHGRGRQTAET
jgi:hypothetical protein